MAFYAILWVLKMLGFSKSKACWVWQRLSNPSSQKPVQRLKDRVTECIRKCSTKALVHGVFRQDRFARRRYCPISLKDESEAVGSQRQPSKGWKLFQVQFRSCSGKSDLQLHVLGIPQHGWHGWHWQRHWMTMDLSSVLTQVWSLKQVDRSKLQKSRQVEPRQHTESFFGISDSAVSGRAGCIVLYWFEWHHWFFQSFSSLQQFAAIPQRKLPQIPVTVKVPAIGLGKFPGTETSRHAKPC